MLGTCDDMINELRAISSEKTEAAAPSGYILCLSEAADAADKTPGADNFRRDILSLEVSKKPNGGWMLVPDFKKIYSLIRKKIESDG